MYPIEKGVPLAKADPGVFPFAQMEVGDSFFVPVDIGYRANWVLRIKQAALSEEGWRFETRQVVGGVRCWRTA